MNRRDFYVLQQGKSRKKWLKWKNKEEQQLRELGVDEEIIQRLHIYDWEEFKSDRRFYEKLADIGEYLDVLFSKKQYYDVLSIEDLLDCIEDEHLLKVLQESDKITLQAIVFKMQDYASKEIAERLGLTRDAVNKRIERFRKKPNKK